MPKTGRPHHFIENLLSHSAKDFRRGTLLCFRTFPVSKSFMLNTGILRFSIENLLPHCTKKHRRGSFLCFTSFLVLETLMHKMGGGAKDYHDFLSSLFVPQCQKNVGELFGVSLVLGIEKICAQEGYVTILCRSFFRLAVSKDFLVEPLVVSQKIWSQKKIRYKMGGKEGLSRFLVESSLSHSAENIRRGNI